MMSPARRRQRGGRTLFCCVKSSAREDLVTINCVGARGGSEINIKLAIAAGEHHGIRKTGVRRRVPGAHRKA